MLPAGVGAAVPVRDSIGARIIATARDGTGGFVNTQKNVGGWPEYKAGVAPKDSDGDGFRTRGRRRTG
jgi:hypothetical protein